MQTASQESVNLVKSIYQNTDVSQIVRYFSPDIEVYQTEQLPWGGHYQGLTGLQQFFTKLRGNVDSQVEIEEIYTAADKVIVKGRTRGTAHKSQKKFDVSIVHIWTMRDGRLAKFEPLVDTNAMLAALQ